MKRTEAAVQTYDRMDQSRSGLQVAFALVFALVALLVLAAAVLIGLVMANQIARPVGELITAAERVRGGDLAVRVAEASTGDELAGLSRAFNRMTGQLGAQRTELMDAYSQLDERRRFTETVLSGVSAGVIGLDPEGCVELPNRAASELLGVDLLGAIGRRLDEVVPEFSALLLEAQLAAQAVGGEADRPRTAELQIGPANARRTPAGAHRRRSQPVRGRAHCRARDRFGRPARAAWAQFRLRRDLRRHHRIAVRPAPGRLVGRGAAHRP